jgi:diguanylate cyclase (GGDEF)-like protein
MRRLVTALYHNWIRQFFLCGSLVFLAILAYFNLLYLNQVPPYSLPLQFTLLLIAFAYLIPTGLAWFSYRTVGLFVMMPVVAAIMVLTSSVTHDFSFIMFIMVEAVFCLMLFYLEQMKDASVMDSNVEIEKAINEQNDLEIAYKEKGMSISVFFEKYTSYYNLRNLANEFSTTLSLKDLSQMIAAKTIELVQKGGGCFLFLSEPDSGHVSLMAAKHRDGMRSLKAKSGDLIDFWVLRNRQSLIIQDTQKDFRFDLKKTGELKQVRSVISSPLVHEGKAIGALRLNADVPSAFTTDDLRILDAISTLASSAISNSILFQKTEDLAIRDSLTNLFVQRYFLERLKEEHRRSLLTKAPLTLLMSDLDHFKQCNDRYGHAVGDLVLLEVAKILREEATDGIVARYGGEEFSILFPKTNLKEGLRVGESIRKRIHDMKFSVRREDIPTTISVGVASMPEDTLDSEELIRIADKRLYRAKEQGRDQVCAGD